MIQVRLNSTDKAILETDDLLENLVPYSLYFDTKIKIQFSQLSFNRIINSIDTSVANRDLQIKNDRN